MQCQQTMMETCNNWDKSQPDKNAVLHTRNIEKWKTRCDHQQRHQWCSNKRNNNTMTAGTTNHFAGAGKQQSATTDLTNANSMKFQNKVNVQTHKMQRSSFDTGLQWQPPRNNAVQIEAVTPMQLFWTKTAWFGSSESQVHLHTQMKVNRSKQDATVSANISLQQRQVLLSNPDSWLAIRQRERAMRHFVLRLERPNLLHWEIFHRKRK